MSTQAAAFEPQLDVRTYLAIVRRRSFYLIVPIVVLFAGACLLAYRLPPVYEATAKILVESQEIRPELAASTVVSSPSQRLEIIQQRLLTRDNLLSIAHKFDLYPLDRQKLSPTDLIDRIQSATDIELLDLEAEAAVEREKKSGTKQDSSTRPQRHSNDPQALGFTVSFDYSDPEIASKVANEFVDHILQQNLEARTNTATWTRKFFDQQVADYNKRLSDLEAQIVDFKKKHEATLPDTLNYRQSTLSQLQSQAAAIDLQINQLKVVAQQQKQTLSDQLDLAKRQLSDTEDERNSVVDLAKKGFFPDNKVREFDRKIAGLQADVQRITSEIATHEDDVGENGRQIVELQSRRTELTKRIAELADGILKTPEVETEYEALTRNYGALQQEMKDAEAKMASANMGEQLEQDRQSERFEVIEQASVPYEPIKPNRRKIILTGGLGGVAIGVGIAAVLEMLNRSVRSSADLERLLQLRPISVIPYVVTAAERKRRIRYMLWTGILLAPFGLAAVLVLVLRSLPL
jgi:uncharacterized protein involved in exopolysaccharide biosynthesis